MTETIVRRRRRVILFSSMFRSKSTAKADSVILLFACMCTNSDRSNPSMQLNTIKLVRIKYILRVSFLRVFRVGTISGLFTLITYLLDVCDYGTSRTVFNVMHWVDINRFVMILKGRTTWQCFIISIIVKFCYPEVVNTVNSILFILCTGKLDWLCSYVSVGYMHEKVSGHNFSKSKLVTHTVYLCVAYEGPICLTILLL